MKRNISSQLPNQPFLQICLLYTSTQKRPEEIGDFLFAKPDIQTA